MLWQWIAQGYPYVTEIATMRDIEYIDLPLAVPQFTQASAARTPDRGGARPS